jgi:hypothetical protein
MVRIFVYFIEDLLDGDPYAWGAAGFLAAVGLAICLFWWKTARDLRREDEQKKSRYYSKKR